MKYVLVFLFACGSSSATQPPPVAPATVAPELTVRCANAIDRAGKTGREGADPDDVATKAQQLMIESCVETTWSNEVLMCFEHGANQDDLRTCPDLMTQAQRDDLNARIQAAGI